ncbi:RtcB family protein [Chloroflexia bacterium SDU3-3]|nr:RtcB family protein [Chloroflexia bacterium SDU3-3]
MSEPRKARSDYRLRRQDAYRLELPNRHGVPVRIFASEQVPIERTAVDELEQLLDTQQTIEALQAAAPDLFEGDASIEAVSLSSDFHRGSGIPIGTTLRTRGVLVPQAVGTDVNCGMRVNLTGLSYEQVAPHLDALERAIRHSFFQGGRGIALSPYQREAMLRGGLPGLVDAVEYAEGEQDLDWGGLLEQLIDELPYIHGGGGAQASVPAMLADYIRGSGGHSYDAHIGSLGGGNHFLELDRIAKIHDRATAHAWSLREGQVVVMVHTGSLGVGHTASAICRQAMRELLPHGFPAPPNGIAILPMGQRCAAQRQAARDAIQAAANFAFANRFFLAHMAMRVLQKTVGDVEPRLLWDSPHNLLWEEEGGAVVHRKGSTPARSPEALMATPYPWGEPVIVPGSMGAPSYILRSLGSADALYSACHGAGRALARGEAQRGHDAELDAFLREFRLVTPVEPAQLQARADLLAAWRQDVKQEAPFAYKQIGPVIETLRGAQVAEPVVELHPILTVKG